MNARDPHVEIVGSWDHEMGCFVNRASYFESVTIPCEVFESELLSDVMSWTLSKLKPGVGETGKIYFSDRKHLAKTLAWGSIIRVTKMGIDDYRCSIMDPRGMTWWRSWSHITNALNWGADCLMGYLVDPPTVSVSSIITIRRVTSSGCAAYMVTQVDIKDGCKTSPIPEVSLRGFFDQALRAVEERLKLQSHKDSSLDNYYISVLQHHKHYHLDADVVLKITVDSRRGDTQYRVSYESENGSGSYCSSFSTLAACLGWVLEMLGDKIHEAD